MPDRSPNATRALIHAPLGRNAALAAQILREADIGSHVCVDLGELCRELDFGAAFVIVSENGLRDANLEPFMAWVEAQPSWSDLPFFILSARAEIARHHPDAMRFTQIFGNVTFLETPFHPTSFVSLARSALRARLRQYRTRNDQIEIQENDERLRFALAAGRLGSWQLDLHSGRLHCSALGNRNFGRPDEKDFSYEVLLASTFNEDREKLRQCFASAIESSGEYLIEIRVVWPDESLHWIEMRGQKLVARSGAVTLLGVSLDITDRKLAEQALRLNEERYRTLIETLPQLVWTCRPDGRCDYVNRQWVAFTGLDLDDRPDMQWLNEVVHQDDRTRTLQHWRGVVAGHHPYDIDYRIRRHDGVYHWFKTRATPIRDDNGKIRSWFGTCTDIQSIVEAQEVLTRGSDQLASLVAHRTEALEAAIAERERVEEVLRQAQKMEAIGQLTGGIAHDFNNLLQVITGGLEIMPHADQRERREALLAGMRRAAERGTQLTRQLLAFSRKQTLKPEPLDLKNQIGMMMELLKRSLRGDIRIETMFVEDLWWAEVDPTQLELAIINIAVNARDAMHESGMLFVLAENVPGDPHTGRPDMVSLSLTDTGEGMDAEVMQRVFEPFFTTKEVGKGSGLGLPQVYGFAKQSGGDVRIVSKVGVGTSVTLLLPRASEQSIKAAVQPAKPEPVEQKTKGDNTVVLLVEDDDEVAALATEMLNQLGYRSTRVSSATAALGALANGRKIDIVFTDVMMPGSMNGAELAREIRKRRPELPIVLTTGYDAAALELAKTEDLPVLRKPYHLTSLFNVLNGTSHHIN